MKKFLLLTLFILIAVSVASAELLSTANPIGKGGWAVEGAYLQDQNVNNNAGGLTLTMATMGGYVGYGAMDKLDVYLDVGSSNIGGLPSVAGTQLATTVTSYGLIGKYTIMEESASMPVSVAVGGGYRVLNWSMTYPAAMGGNQTADGAQMMVGLGVSKIIIPFVPYAGFAYRSTTQKGKAYTTQMDITVGTAIAWSMQGAVLLEYTNQSITPDGGSAYTSGQMAAGVAYKI